MKRDPMMEDQAGNLTAVTPEVRAHPVRRSFSGEDKVYFCYW
jgi:hypothetical protein